MADQIKYSRQTVNIWFPNQVEPELPLRSQYKLLSDYERDLKVFTNYWKLEKERLLNGFKIADNKVYISGWLYWNTVYWNIERYKTINNRRTKTVSTPEFRDIDWEMSINREKALDQGKFIMLVGARNFGKSVWDSSIAGYCYTLFDNSEVIISAGHQTDIKVVTDKIQTGLVYLHPIFKKQRLKNDWGKEVRAGFKDKKSGDVSEKSSNSRIAICNYEAGNNTMATNGRRPMFHVIDEIGKISNFIGCVKDSDGCWWDTDEIKPGEAVMPSCLPMFTGTGGDMEVGKEASDMFFKPDGYNLLEFDDEWEHTGKIGWFMPVTKARFEFKKPMKLSQYLNIQHPELDKINILVSDEKECLKKFVEPKRKEAEKTGSTKAILKHKAYWPTKPSESFLTISQNDFDIESAKSQQIKLRNNNITGTPIELIYDANDKLIHKISDKHPISEFPIISDSPIGCIVMYEAPISNPPYGLYVIGVDPYKQDTAKYSDSCGAVYVFKRIHDIQSEQYQDMFVAQYVGRPNTLNEWCEIARRLTKYYNARVFCENEDKGFIDYMILKNEGYYLEDQPEWIKDISPNSNVQRAKGIHATPAIKAHIRGQLKMYLDETLIKEELPDGTIKETRGVSKILDSILLEEIIKFNKTGNFDRIIAAGLAITLARKMDPVIKVGEDYESEIYASLVSNMRGGSSVISSFGNNNSNNNSSRNNNNRNRFNLF